MARRLQRFKEKDTRKLFGVDPGRQDARHRRRCSAVMKVFGFFFEDRRPAHRHSRTWRTRRTTSSARSTRCGCWSPRSWCSSCRRASWPSRPGFARSRETVNIMMECVFDTCLCGILYWAIGFAFQFGVGNGLIGHQYFFLHGAPATYDYGGLFDTDVAFLAFFLFQFAFADTASTITSGAMVGRTSFKGDILYSACVSGFIYPIFGHWVWGPGGWLGTTMGWFNGIVRGRHRASVTSPARPSCTPSAACIALCGRHRPRAPPRPQVQARRRRPHAAARPQHRRHRRRDPVVRLVRLQPRLDAVGAWTSRASAGSPPTPRWRPAPAAWSPCSSSIPRSKKWDLGHVAQRLPRRPRRHHRAVLLGVTGRRGHHRRHRRHHRAARRRPASSTSGSTTRSARWPSTWAAASGARSPSGCSPPASSASPGPTGPTTPRRSRACSTAAAPTSCWPRSSAASAASWSVSVVVARHLQDHPVAAGQLEPPARAGPRARGHRHRRARHPAYHMEFGQGMTLHDAAGHRRAARLAERTLRPSSVGRRSTARSDTDARRKDSTWLIS